MSSISPLREYLPLKQGLRPDTERERVQRTSQRVSSIKTRIKTMVLGSVHSHSLLREYLPLKQGLRPDDRVNKEAAQWLREYLPLKQGLSAN